MDIKLPGNMPNFDKSKLEGSIIVFLVAGHGFGP